MNIFTLNRKYIVTNSFVFFLLAFLIRLIFLFFQNPSFDTLIEDELLYWNNASTYLDKGLLEESIIAERMPGIFIYTKVLLFLSFKNLKIYLTLQSIFDALTCVIILGTGRIIFPKQKIYIYLSAILSPLMIILSAQVLSETIFLFFFSIFLYFSVKIIKSNNYLYYNIACAGIFLGLTTSIRSITYPLILLSIFPFVFILIKRNIIKYKILVFCMIFLFFSLLPISNRIHNNFKLHDTFSLTSQAGTHLAYWVAPMIISETKNISRKEAIIIINQIAQKYTLTDDYYKNDKILRKVGLEALSQINKSDIIFHWTKAALINLVAPSLLLDKSLRSLPHPSYYETGNMLLWVKLIFSNSEYFHYLLIVSVASLTCLFTVISFIIGSLYIYKNERILFYLISLYILYFLLITGPVLSPKYIFPILPCIFLYQGITLFKIINYFKTLLRK